MLTTQQILAVCIIFLCGCALTILSTVDDPPPRL